MPDETVPHVCLLIDFENLVLGLQKMVQGELADELDVSLLFRLAEEHGQVVLANAYADWRNGLFNQFQLDLDRLGIELIHVLGRGFKNAVDVKLAVDSIETLWTLPHIHTFVIVSGDRDFIHILKTLRRHGKKIVGVSPDVSASEDFAALCDSFVKYSALKSTYSEGTTAAVATAAERNQLERTLAGLLAKAEQGIKGALLKLQLKRELGHTFDESAYGYAKFSELLCAMPQLARVEVFPVGDIMVYPVNASAAVLSTGPVAPQRHAVSAGNEVLNIYRFQPDPVRRRQLLRQLFDAMGAAGDSFTQNQIAQRVLEDSQDPALSIPVLSKYFALLYQARAFIVLPYEPSVPVWQRQLKRRFRYDNFDEFVRAYEGSIALKLCAADLNLDATALARLLGLDVQANEADAFWCAEIYQQARSQLARPASVIIPE